MARVALRLVPHVHRLGLDLGLGMVLATNLCAISGSVVCVAAIREPFVVWFWAKVPHRPNVAWCGRWIWISDGSGLDLARVALRLGHMCIDWGLILGWSWCWQPICVQSRAVWYA